MRDTGTLAFRYSKPLTVRLFPCQGLKAGEMTAFKRSRAKTYSRIDMQLRRNYSQLNKSAHRAPGAPFTTTE